MKKRDVFLLFTLLGIATVFIAFSSEMRKGAYQGLALAENTIIPSLLPLLIIFLLIMKTGAKDVLARLLGNISLYAFNLPKVTFPAIFLGMIGGYPTGALLTQELFDKGEIDSSQAKVIMRFNLCGGCGFIITAVGSVSLLNLKAGIILFFSNVISNIIIGIAQGIGRKRTDSGFYSFTESIKISDALTSAVSSSVNSVLNITAFVILFSAINEILKLPEFLLPILEITNGICDGGKFSLPEISTYLAFGGLCIHFQLLPILMKMGVNYGDFLIFRVISALLSYCITKGLLWVFPMELEVFSNTSDTVAVFSSVNIGLSALLIIGCFVLILDINSKKKIC